MSLPIGTRVGPYEITGTLGAGGMGEVYRARDSRLGRDVALKVLPELFATDPERLARFEREAQVLAALKHPNIGAIYGLEEGPSKDGPRIRALVLELIDGDTLADRIARGAIPMDEALPIATQIAEALAAAHEQGVIHRDLKPSNIKVTPNGHAKVLDFGLAKLNDPTVPNSPNASHPLSMSPTITSPAATMAGVILGTAAYMAPEQAKGQAADKRSDVWAFGCVLFEMLTGRRAFEADDLSDTLALVLKGDPDWRALPADLPPAVRTLIRASLEKERRLRLTDISGALFVFAHDRDLAPASAATPAGSTWRRRATLGAAFVMTAAFAAMAVWLTTRPDPAPVSRFFVAPPDDAAYVTGGRPGTSAAISPDGRMLAFTARNAAGRVTLWVRSIDALTAQPLAGTDDADFPFWSPDSRFIGYFTQDKLLKIAAAGGPSQTLCPVSLGRGGTWSREGQIVFGVNGGPLFRVSSAGGQPSAVTQLASGVQDHRFPSFLPDGRHVLYSVTAAQSIGGAYVTSLDSGETRRVVEADTGAIYDQHDAYLLFGRQGTLMAQSFDAKTLTLANEPFPFAEGLESGVFAGVLAFSVSENGTLAYGLGVSRAGIRRLVWIDRQGKVVATIGQGGNYRGPDLSPDGKRLAIKRRDIQGGDIWVIDTSRDTTSRFTFDSSQDNSSPIWSPDGSRIVFSSLRSRRAGLYVKPANGTGGEERLFESESLVVPVSWAPDGRSIVYVTQDPKTREDLWLLPLSGDRKPVPLVTTPFNDDRGQISPDGKWLAYDSSETGQAEVYVRPFPLGDGKWQVSTGGGADPRWRGDRHELFYMDTNGAGKLIAVDVRATGSMFDVGTPRALFDSGFVLVGGEQIGPRAYVASADGQRFLIPRIPASLTPDSGSSIAVVLNWAQGIQH